MSIKSILSIGASLALAAGAVAAVNSADPLVTAVRVPNQGLQPEIVVDAGGTLHMTYYLGDPKNGDIYYVRSKDELKTFSEPIRVNSQEGSSIAMGTIRGPQLAVGKEGRVHVAWFGSGKALPRGPVDPNAKAMPGMPAGGAPMLYSRSNPEGTAFEPQRNLMQRTFMLDGGGSLTADAKGNVVVGWHANTGNEKTEEQRRVWITRSEDEGKTFAREVAAWDKPTGACACCSVRLFTDKEGRVQVLYRAAEKMENRDTYLLQSSDGGKRFAGAFVHPWKVRSCPMSSYSLIQSGDTLIAAWESNEQVYMAAIDPNTLDVSEPIAAPGEAEKRKHPRVAINSRGQVLLAWTEGMGWNQSGSVAWQVFDTKGEPLKGASGRKNGVPTWSFIAAIAKPDNTFAVIY